MAERVLPTDPYKRIEELLFPSDPTYCAEPLSIDDARWLFGALYRAQLQAKDAIPMEPLRAFVKALGL